MRKHGYSLTQTVLVESLRQEIHLFVISFQQDQSSKTRRRSSHRRHTGSLQGYSWSCDYRETPFLLQTNELAMSTADSHPWQRALYIGPTLQFSKVSTHDTDIQSHLVPLAMSPSSLLHHFCCAPNVCYPIPTSFLVESFYPVIQDIEIKDIIRVIRVRQKLQRQSKKYFMNYFRHCLGRAWQHIGWRLWVRNRRGVMDGTQVFGATPEGL